MNVDQEEVPRSTRRIRRAMGVAKVLVTDPDASRCAKIAFVLPTSHLVYVAQEPTMALALAVRERPTMVIANRTLGAMPIEQFIALLDYAYPGVVPPFVVIGDDVDLAPPIAAVLHENADSDDIRCAVEDVIARFPGETS